MNLRDLMNKLDAISEAEAPVDAQRAAYDQFRADDAKKAAIDAVKKMTVPNGNSNYIDPKDGVIKYMDNQTGRGGGEGSVKEFSYDWYKKGQEKPFFDQLKAAGLEVIPVERKQLFGTFQVAGVDLAKLATLGQAPAPATPTQANPAQQAQADATSAKVNGENIKKLTDLTYKLSITKGAAPAAKAAAPAAKAAATAQQPQGKGPAFGGYGQRQAPAAAPATLGEGIQFNGAIANALVESFGYDKLDELTVPKGAGNAIDNIGSAWNGAKNWFSGFGKGVSNPRSTNLPSVANGTTANAKGIRTGAAFGGNPGKVAAGSAALGAGAAMLAANGQPATAEVPGVSTQPETNPAPAPAPAPAGGGPTPEQLEIIKQMQEIMKQLADTGTPEANQAISNAQEQISKITASPAQAALDSANAQGDRDALDAANPGTPAAGVAFNQGKPGETQMAQTAAAANPGTPAAGVAFNQGVNAQGQNTTIRHADGSSTNPETGVVTPASIISNSPVVQASQGKPGENNMARTAATNESSDELARWLRIARGR